MTVGQLRLANQDDVDALNTRLDTALDDLAASAIVDGTITEAKLTTDLANKIDGGYVKPNTGIPAADLAVAVQSELALAASALQVAPVVSVNGQTGAVTVATGGPAVGSNAWLVASLPALAFPSITRNGNEAVTTATVVWPDGTGGTWTSDTLSTAFPGAIDAYHVTYVGGSTKTVTQSAVSRDAAGAVTAQPALVVS